MKFIYSSDIHGDMNKYYKLEELCMDNNIKYLVLGGDLLYKNFGDREPVQRESIEKNIKPFYESLYKNGITVISILGNDDLECVEEQYYNMIKEYPNIIDVDNKRIDIEGISFIGLNKVIDAPFKRKDHVVIEEGQVMPKQHSDKIYVDGCKRVISIEEWEKERLLRDRMKDCLDRLPKGGKKTIYILHDPPANIGLDWCRDGDKAGSNDIYDFLYKSNAYMSLHGHIHESYWLSNKWYDNINGTIAIQVGQSEIGENPLCYAIVDTDDNKYERYEIDVN